jgi:hypothetical protein
MSKAPTSRWLPQACTLPTLDKPLRLLEFADLFADAVTGVQRLGPTRLRLAFTGGADVAERVRDLTAREAECCSFFTFTLTRDADDDLVLDVLVPAGYVDALDGLQLLAGTAA